MADTGSKNIPRSVLIFLEEKELPPIDPGRGQSFSRTTRSFAKTQGQEEKGARYSRCFVSRCFIYVLAPRSKFSRHGYRDATTRGIMQNFPQAFYSRASFREAQTWKPCACFSFYLCLETSLAGERAPSKLPYECSTPTVISADPPENRCLATPAGIRGNRTDINPPCRGSTPFAGRRPLVFRGRFRGSVLAIFAAVREIRDLIKESTVDQDTRK